MPWKALQARRLARRSPLPWAFAILALAFAGPARAVEVSASLQAEGANGDSNVITVTSRQAALTVTKVEVNRGNCKANVYASLPRRLVFGETILVRVFPCIPVEVQVATTEGDSVLTFGTNAIDHEVEIEKIDLGYHAARIRVFNYRDAPLLMKEIVVNRGSCGSDGHIRLIVPRSLSFGDYFTTGGLFCGPVEATVLSDGEPVTVTWDK